MRLIEISSITYDDFKYIRWRLWTERDTKFGPISCEYESDHKFMRIQMWDQKYIPDWLKEEYPDVTIW